ncbi:hypothetical protein [Escherichia albertii]|uniref:hypothetical protein n=1 Tax=Escherichia albertii TaxID=208962 RepID=UPI000743B2ED|nr:hypothetical protein [Escherichia albertii]MCB2258558.1 hypothetical protein [Escherichia albertii]MCB2265764.1 hypothetical protein [Escherichia albertii]MCB2271033.1 hypothetical protein [Escherichia albertii]HEB1529132.1 hypothetical protein [Escherichia albertii]HEB1542009.1 hypothetical protein [Escherichia albertii]
MQRWQTCLFILLLCGFSTSVLSNETVDEAITRLYQPLTDNDALPLSDGFISDLRNNQSTTPGGISPWLNNYLLCRCLDDAFVSAEIIQTAPLNAGRVHVLMQLVIKQNGADMRRLLGLTLVRGREKSHWLLEDTDDGTEIPKSLRAEIREDTRIKNTAAKATPEHNSVSMTALLAQPEKYHLQKVIVEGVGNIEFEDDALYLNKDSWENYVSEDSLWLDIDFPNPVVTLARARQLNGDYVLIAGTFDMDISGHLGARHGGITDITRYERVTTRKEYERKRELEIKKIEAQKRQDEVKD